MSSPFFLAHPKHPSHAWFWGIASLLVLPGALVLGSYVGLSAVYSFFLGILATLLVLLLNVAMEGSLWMYQAQWKHVFERPDASFRLVVVAGALLLIVESLAIMYLLVSTSADDALLVLVRQHRCLAPEPRFLELCNLLTSR